MFSRDVQLAPGLRNNRRRPRGSVREASDDRGCNGSGWPGFTWENGDVAALSRRCCFSTDTFDHRCLRRRCPESLPLPRHRSHQYVNRLQFELEQPEFSEVRNCVTGFSHELAVPPSRRRHDFSPPAVTTLTCGALAEADRGTSARISVPRMGSEWTDSVPPTSRSLSRMLTRPMPTLVLRRAGSKPTPASTIRKRISLFVPLHAT